MMDIPDVEHRYAAEHSLPFATIFDELFAIRGDDAEPPGVPTLASLVDQWLPGEGTAQQRIAEQISRSEVAYAELEKRKRGRDYHVDEDAACEVLDRPLLEILHRLPRTALCLSGGGIRSASFALGVLQGLAEFNNTDDVNRCEKDAAPSALEEFDYLSTVSGGGYIGSWLMAWTSRLTKRMSPRAAFHAVANELAGCGGHTSGDPAPRALRHLREYTSYLAPKLGLTLDSWTLAALVFRNLIVNWVMILPLALAFVAGLQVLHYGLFWLSLEMTSPRVEGWWWTIGALFVFSGIMAGFRMPSTYMVVHGKRQLRTGFVFCVYILPLIVGSLLVVELWFDLGPGWALARNLILVRMAVVAFLTFVSVPIIRGLVRKEGRRLVRVEHGVLTYLGAGIAAALVTSVLLAVSLHAIGAKVFENMGPGFSVAAQGEGGHSRLTHLESHFSSMAQSSTATQASGPVANRLVYERGSWGATRFVLFAFPALWLLLIAASALFSGFLGIFEEDVDREWWARAGGLMLGVVGGWVIAEGTVILAPTMIHALRSEVATAVASTGLLAGLAGALGGASTAGGIGASGGKHADISKFGAFLNRFGLLVPTLCTIALLMAVLLMAVLEMKIATAMGGPEATKTHLKIFLGAAAVGVLVNWAININIFSLHGMYRMRLMRAFLGASNTQRVPNPFTGFDDRDNVFEKDVPTGRGVPLHLVNATVNLVGTKKLAWRQRKAEGFTFSPLHCGGWRLGYVKTAHYGRHGGLSLGTAMAISGAAFNPNMGYHSSPLVTLLMTLFNVRLGWWLPNPKYRRSPLHEKICKRFGITMRTFLEKKAPRLALGPLLRESFGGTDDLSAYIELTDGGHFENLGIYEMMLRRVKLIVVVDAGADPDCQLEDLGNALRKIEIDLGIPIIFRDGIRMKAGPKKDNLYCALADIRYEYVDNVKPVPMGRLLYIKAGLNGEEPPDITQYARTHKSFPHESTANQFFNEAQFESYRHLGHHVLRTILKRSLKEKSAIDVPLDANGQQSIEALFRKAKEYVDAGIPPNGEHDAAAPDRSV